MSEVYLYGVVGEDLLAADLIAELKGARGAPLNVRINSPGGSVTEGVAIYNAIRRDGRRVVVHVDAMAASIASVIAMAGDEIIIAENAQMMIHDPWSIVAGTSQDLRKVADQIDATRKIIVDIYAKRTGKSADEISSMMAAETFLSAEEALAAGFATHIDQPMKIAAMQPLSPEALSRLLLKTEGARRAGKDQMTSQNAAATPNADTPTIASVESIVKAERDRAATISAAVRNARLDPAFAEKLISEGATIEQANARIIDRFAEVNAAATGPEIRNVYVSRDEGVTARQGVEDALFAKLTAKAPSDIARPYMSLTMQAMGVALGAPQNGLAMVSATKAAC